jgi:hypothetical protein
VKMDGHTCGRDPRNASAKPCPKSGLGCTWKRCDGKRPGPCASGRGPPPDHEDAWPPVAGHSAHGAGNRRVCALRPHPLVLERSLRVNRWPGRGAARVPSSPRDQQIGAGAMLGEGRWRDLLRPAR